MQPRHTRLAIFLLLGLAGAMLLAGVLGGGAPARALLRHHAALAGWVVAHPGAAGALYVGAYVVALVAMLPVSAMLSVLGGLLFGALAGAGLAFAGGVSGAVLSYLLARRALGPTAADRLGPRGQRLTQAVRRNAWPCLLALRLAPVAPAPLVNLAPALAGVGLLPFAVTTALGLMPLSVLYAQAGAGLAAVLAGGDKVDLAHVLTGPQIAGLMALAGLALLAIPLRRRLGL